MRAICGVPQPPSYTVVAIALLYLVNQTSGRVLSRPACGNGPLQCIVHLCSNSDAGTCAPTNGLLLVCPLSRNSIGGLRANGCILRGLQFIQKCVLLQKTLAVANATASVSKTKSVQLVVRGDNRRTTGSCQSLYTFIQYLTDGVLQRS